MVVSNRLPFKAVPDPDGNLTLERTSGGLATALHALLAQSGGEWIGWSGGADDAVAAHLAKLCEGLPYRLQPLTLEPEEALLFYNGFSNRTLWPLFHDFPSLAAYDARMWEAYVRTNARFAAAAAPRLAPGDVLWIHDYHLFLFARMLAQRPAGTRIGHFNHIPFPQRDLFRRLPWRREILEGILAYDLVGFQSRRDLHNFVECVVDLVPHATVAGVQADRVTLAAGLRQRCRAGVFPIGIDFALFDRLARQERVQRLARRLRLLYPGRKIVLGIDRLDYSKGLPNRLRAFEILLERRPALRSKVTLIQIAVPSRAEVQEYQRLRAEIDGLIGRINGRFTQAGWVPIHYLYRSISQEELVAFYHTSDVGLVTPLKDGMNLVAKEFCAASHDGRGALILSEFAGAAEELAARGALVVNPHDIQALAATIHRALAMGEREQRARMTRLREAVRRGDVQTWARTFLSELNAFPVDTPTRRRAAGRPSTRGRAAPGRMKPLRPHLPRILAAFQRAHRRTILLDFDGTLSPIVRRPARAALPAGTRRLLRRLARRPGLRVGIVTGRALADIRARCPIPEAFFIANHGYETGGAGGARRRHYPGDAPAWIRQAERRLREALARHAGVRLENKGPVLAVHYRASTPEGAAAARRAVAALVRRQSTHFILAEGKRVVEIRPRPVRTKGQAAREALRAAGGGWAAYFGDDVTDETAFRALAGRALTVYVGPPDRRFSARYRVPDTRAVARVLARFDRALDARGVPPTTPRRASRRTTSASGRRTRSSRPRSAPGGRS